MTVECGFSAVSVGGAEDDEQAMQVASMLLASVDPGEARLVGTISGYIIAATSSAVVSVRKVNPPTVDAIRKEAEAFAAGRGALQYWGGTIQTRKRPELSAVNFAPSKSLTRAACVLRVGKSQSPSRSMPNGYEDAREWLAEEKESRMVVAVLQPLEPLLVSVASIYTAAGEAVIATGAGAAAALKGIGEAARAVGETAKEAASYAGLALLAGGAFVLWRLFGKGR